MKKLTSLFQLICSLAVFSLIFSTAYAQDVAIKGDANNDGIINAADIAEITAYIMGSPSARFNFSNADINGDGTVNNADIKAISSLIMDSYIGKEDVEAVLFYMNEEQVSPDAPFVVSLMSDNAIFGFINNDLHVVLLLLDYYAYQWYIVHSTEMGALLYPYNPDTEEMGDRIIAYNEYDNQTRIGFFQADWEKNEFVADTLIVKNLLPQAHSSRRVPSHWKNDPLISGVLERTGQLLGDCSKQLNVFKNAVDKLKSYCPEYSWMDTAVDVLGLESNVTNAMAKQFESGNPWNVRFEKVEYETGKSIIVDQVADLSQDQAIELFNQFGTNVNKEDVKEVLGWVKLGESIRDLHADESTIEDVKHIAERMWNRAEYVNNAIPLKMIDLRFQPEYDVSIGVSDVTTNSAVLNGSFKEIYGGAAIIKMGYHLIGPDGEEDIEAFKLSSKLVNGLKPGTTYRVYAYLSSANTPSGKFTSETVSFTTKDVEFSVSPTSVHFGPEGGESSVKVTISEGITWSVTSKPSWISVVEAPATLNIRCDKTKEKRSGTIVVSAQISNEETLTQTISVTQDIEDTYIPVPGDIIFEGTTTIHSKSTSWTDGSLTDTQNSDTTEDLSTAMRMENGQYYFIDLAENNVMDMTMFHHESKEWDEAGWHYKVVQNNYTATENEIRMSCEIVGDSQNHTEDNSQYGWVHQDLTSVLSITASIVITELQTPSPKLSGVVNLTTTTDQVISYNYGGFTSTMTSKTETIVDGISNAIGHYVTEENSTQYKPSQPLSIRSDIFRGLLKNRKGFEKAAETSVSK